MDAEARAKLDAARANNNSIGGSSAGVLQPSAKLASQMAGVKGKLATPSGTPAPTPPASGGLPSGSLSAPASGGGPKLVLRKPASSSASSKLFRKTSSMSTASKLRVNKLSSATSSTVGGSSDDAFEDVETTQKGIEQQKQKELDDQKKQQEEDTALAKKLQEELNGLGGSSNGGTASSQTTVPATPTSTPASGIAVATSNPPKPQMSAMEQSMAKLSAMNSDFFSGM
jgi:hypothetical protein